MMGEMPRGAKRVVRGARRAGRRLAMSSTEINPPTLPDQFGPYRIVRPLGKGGMGAVYLARDTRLDRDVALKVCTLADNATALERFRREARAAASLSHQHLCPVYEFDVRDGIAYLTMAYVEGPTLSTWAAKRGGLSQRDAARLVAKLALAMQVAHDGGVVHRDLKPANVIINQKGEPVILDFGLARQMEDARTRLTQVGAIYGTPSYMAPEQAGGDPELIGPASDVYSLGVILYELLTGRVPFEGPLTAVLGQLLSMPPIPPRKYNPLVDATLEAICLKALAKSPAERPRSMRDFARALAKIAPGLSAAAAMPDPRLQPTTQATSATSPEARPVNKPGSGGPAGTTPVAPLDAELVALPVPAPPEIVALPVARPLKAPAPPPLPPGTTTAPRRRSGAAEEWVRPRREPETGHQLAWIIGGLVAFVVLLAGVIILVVMLRRGDSSDSDDADHGFGSNGDSPMANAANRTQSQNNLKQIGLALQSYHEANGMFPPAVIGAMGVKGRPPVSWRVAILPYIEEDPLYREWNFDEPYDGPNNRKLWSRMPKTYQLPGKSADSTETYYQGFVGKGTVFDNPLGTRIAQIKDGTSFTIMVVEAKDPVVWCAPDDIPFSERPEGFDLHQVGGHYGKSVSVLLCDGTVRTVRHTMSPLDFQHAIIIDDGNVFDWPER
jgi:serine/threonine protein kinase